MKNNYINTNQSFQEALLETIKERMDIAQAFPLRTVLGHVFYFGMKYYNGIIGYVNPCAWFMYYIQDRFFSKHYDVKNISRYYNNPNTKELKGGKYLSENELKLGHHEGVTPIRKLDNMSDSIDIEILKYREPLAKLFSTHRAITI